MTQPLQNHTIQDLLAFYDRVNPVLSKWLVKPEWTAEETAMLCAGLIPNENKEVEAAIASDVPESSSSVMPCDPEGYIPADYELYDGYLHLLAGKGAAAPRDMVDMLRPAITWEISKTNQGAGPPSLRVQTLDSLNNLQWLLIIGNAVGLNMPALVPFGLLNGLRDRLTSQAGTELPTRRKKGGLADAGGAVQTKSRTGQRKPRRYPPVLATPEARGYYTTAEVAGLTGLQTDTLNRYARKGMAAHGFTPFKHQNGRSWQWRDNWQQVLHMTSGSVPGELGPQQTKSLALFLGPKPFTKS
ncbi:hypothetical protein ACNRDB_14610 [Ralstonia pseudosolanacearum]|uniref:hypothetical protein n=1 Tax=Ralstonia pseudosolanacearum TaxID=1310165 RepID=UPI0018D17C2D|nr:hypothetical protein [Ralstonia pseudosolanacearum]